MSYNTSTERRSLPPPPNNGHRPLQKLLSGWALVFFGASMMLPFKDETPGLAAVFTILGHPTEVLYWLFPIGTILFLCVIFRLHETSLPIFKALLISILMLLAVVNLYFDRNGMTVGVGVTFWLSSGYILIAAAVRWRYPRGGIKLGFTALILAVTLTIWVQNIYKGGNGGHIWKGSQQADESMLPSPKTVPDSVVPANVHGASAGVDTSEPSADNLSSLSRSTLIAVDRDRSIYNPWEEKDIQPNCESSIKRHYPVLLPPRFSEDGFEWRNYQHSDAVCNTLMYVGTPGLSKKPELDYKIAQDHRDNTYLLLVNKKGKELFKETFTPSDNSLMDSDYVAKLNQGFVRMVDNPNAQLIDNEYVFSKADIPKQSDIMVRGCEWKPVNGRSNTYQWGTGRINWRGQSLIKPVNFCSKTYVGVAHLSRDPQAPLSNNNLENRLYVKLFQGSDLKPVECGAVSLPMTATDVQAWHSGQLQAENIQIEPSSGAVCLNVTVKLNDGRTMSNNNG